VHNWGDALPQCRSHACTPGSSPTTRPAFQRRAWRNGVPCVSSALSGPRRSPFSNPRLEDNKIGRTARFHKETRSRWTTSIPRGVPRGSRKAKKAQVHDYALAEFAPRHDLTKRSRKMVVLTSDTHCASGLEGLRGQRERKSWNEHPLNRKASFSGRMLSGERGRESHRGRVLILSSRAFG
jgi:hypothetical protein